MSQTKFKPIPRPGTFQARIPAVELAEKLSRDPSYAQAKTLIEECLLVTENKNLVLATASVVTLATMDTDVGNFIRTKIETGKLPILEAGAEIAFKHPEEITDEKAAETSLIYSALIGGASRPAFVETVMPLEAIANEQDNILVPLSFTKTAFKQTLFDELGKNYIRVDSDMQIIDMVSKLREHAIVVPLDEEKIESSVQRIVPPWYRVLYEASAGGGKSGRCGFLRFSDLLDGYYQGIVVSLNKGQMQYSDFKPAFDSFLLQRKHFLSQVKKRKKNADNNSVLTEEIQKDKFAELSPEEDQPDDQQSRTSEDSVIADLEFVEITMDSLKNIATQEGATSDDDLHAFKFKKKKHKDITLRSQITKPKPSEIEQPRRSTRTKGRTKGK